MDKILKVLPARIKEICKEGSFHPDEQWKLQAIDTLCQKIASLLGHLESRGFDAEEKLSAIVDEYKNVYQQNTKSLHFCDFLSYCNEITETYISLYNRNEVLELCYLAGLGVRSTGDGTFKEPSWNLISSWAKKYSLQLNGYRPNLSSLSVNFSHPTDFWENVGQKKYGFQNLRDFYWNKKLIEGANDCPPILKACLSEKYTENDIRLIVLRFLLDGPCFKTASTLVVRLTKHYKKGAESRKDFLDRLEMLKGQNIGLHARQYLSLAKELVDPEPKVGNSDKWMDAHRPHYIYRFSSSGAVNVTFGRWDGTNAGIFTILSIRENGEVYLKTLWTGNPTSFSQAKLFGVQKNWKSPEGPEKRQSQKKSNWNQAERRLK